MRNDIVTKIERIHDKQHRQRPSMDHTSYNEFEKLKGPHALYSADLSPTNSHF